MSEGDVGTGGIILWMMLFVVVGMPFVYLIWNFINHLLSGRFVPLDFGLAIVGLVGAVIVLRTVARRTARWDTT